MLPNPKNTTKGNVPAESKLSEAISLLTKKPLITLAVIAAIPIVLMLAFTFKSGYTPSSKNSEYDKIVVVKTPTEIADEATAALQKKDTQTFLNILNEQAKNNPNIVNSKGDPLIVAAATMGNLDAVQQLILNGADVNKTNSFNKDTALLRSLYGNFPEITRLLVYSGADINAKNNYNHSPMYIALEKKQAEFIDLFLSSGVREGLNTAYLFRASAQKNPMGVLAMLKGGIDPNVKNEKGNTPLIISASLGDVPSVQSLMAYRADVNAANNDGNTALIYAAGAAKGYEEVVRRLLAADADPTIAANDGLIPYMIARKNNRGQVLKWFDMDLTQVKNSVIEQDNAALMAQAKAEGRELPQLGQQSQEKPVTDADIFTAAQTGDMELAKKVIAANKAVVFDKNKAGETPLAVAVENGHKDIVTYLVDNMARFYESSPKGNVFHIAVRTQNMDMLKHLVALARKEGRLAMMLEYRVAPQKNAQPMTPLGFAALLCNKEIYDYLVSIGAKTGGISKNDNILGYKCPRPKRSPARPPGAAVKQS